MKLLFIVGGHKAVLGTDLRPAVIFIGGMLPIDIGWVKTGHHLNI